MVQEAAGLFRQFTALQKNGTFTKTCRVMKNKEAKKVPDQGKS